MECCYLFRHIILVFLAIIVLLSKMCWEEVSVHLLILLVESLILVYLLIFVSLGLILLG